MVASIAAAADAEKVFSLCWNNILRSPVFLYSRGIFHLHVFLLLAYNIHTYLGQRGYNDQCMPKSSRNIPQMGEKDECLYSGFSSFFPPSSPHSHRFFCCRGRKEEKSTFQAKIPSFPFCWQSALTCNKIYNVYTPSVYTYQARYILVHSLINRGYKKIIPPLENGKERFPIRDC